MCCDCLPQAAQTGVACGHADSLLHVAEHVHGVASVAAGAVALEPGAVEQRLAAQHDVGGLRLLDDLQPAGGRIGFVLFGALVVVAL